MTDDRSRPELERPDLGQLTRRRFLHLSGGSIATVATGAVLAACGTAATPGSSAAPTITATPIPTEAAGPKRGGRLRVALSGGGNAETLNPNVSQSEMDDARNSSLYEGLTKWDGDGVLLFNLLGWKNRGARRTH